MSGPPPKPVEQKRRAGNPGKRPLPEPVVHLAAAATIPPAPDSLRSHGRAAWERLWTAGQVWLSPATDIDIMRRLCEAHDMREAMRDAIAEEGFYVLGSQGQSRPNPLLDKLFMLEAQITRWESLCGFTPSDRSRLGVAEVKRASALEDLLSRRAQHG